MEAMTGDASTSNFGFSVALNSSGSILAIGAIGGGLGTGNASVREWNGSSWSFLGLVFAVGVDTSSESGQSIELSGDGKRCIVGSLGYCSIFEWDGTTWNQMGSNITGTSSAFGRSVSISGDGKTIAVCKGSDSGQVFLYRWAGTVWNQLGQTLSGNQEFGSSASLNVEGNIVAVGQQEFGTDTVSDIGKVYVYELRNGTCFSVGSFEGAHESGLTGHDVSISDDGTIVAASGPAIGTLAPGHFISYNVESTTKVVKKDVNKYIRIVL